MQHLKKLRIECGVSENKGKGTWNGHITLHWPDRPKEAFFYPGDPGKPFRSAQDASEWCQAQVQVIMEKMGAATRRARLIV